MSTEQAAELPRREFDALLDHVYEYGTMVEGAKELALAMCRAYAEQHAEALREDLKTARDAALEEAIRICQDFGAEADSPDELFYDGATAYECAARIDYARCSWEAFKRAALSTDQAERKP